MDEDAGEEIDRVERIAEWLADLSPSAFRICRGILFESGSFADRIWLPNPGLGLVNRRVTLLILKAFQIMLFLETFPGLLL